MGSYITDARTGEQVPLTETLSWVTCLLNGHTWRWDLVVDQRYRALHIGCIHTDISVYPSGNLSWPGHSAMQFDSADDAKRYVEATWILEGGE